MGRQPADFLSGRREEPRTHVLATTLALDACLAHPGPADEVAERGRSLKRALRHSAVQKMAFRQGIERM